MAKTKGPLFSLEASGSVAKTIVYSQWKGRNYVRQHTIPLNPQSPAQVNVRAAMTLLVAAWQGEIQGTKDSWNTYGKLTNLSGFNAYVSRGMDQYVIQITTAVTPVSVSVVGVPPSDVWTWT